VKEEPGTQPFDVLIVLASLRAEGTPRMALDFCRWWAEWGLTVGVVELGRGSQDLRKAFQSLDVTIDSIGSRGSDALRYSRLAREVSAVVRRRGVEAVLSMPLGLHSFVAWGARLGGARRIATHVGNPPLSGVSSAVTRAKAQVLSALGRPVTDAWVCCSEYVQSAAIEQLRVPRRRTVVVYNGVNGGAFSEAAAASRRPAMVDGRPPLIGMVGTLEDHKDQATLIGAAAQLTREGQRVQVQLIGEGARRMSLQALVDELAAPVALLGSRADVADLVTQLDLFVFSTTAEEGLGIALIEAMAAGVPVVASDVPACREVLDDGALGVLVPPGDAAALAAAIAGVLALPKAAAERAAAARERALTMFSAETMARRYAEILGLPVPPAPAAVGRG